MAAQVIRASLRIYTIGYGNRKFDDFVALLKRLGVELVIDVRRFPASKWPEFAKGNLEEALPQRGLGYVHLRELGGYRKGGYESYMRSESFGEGMRRLQELARGRTAVVMCVESHPSGCHRRFIAEALKGLGWEVVHIVGRKGEQRIL